MSCFGCYFNPCRCVSKCPANRIQDLVHIECDPDPEDGIESDHDYEVWSKAITAYRTMIKARIEMLDTHRRTAHVYEGTVYKGIKCMDCNNTL